MPDPAPPANVALPPRQYYPLAALLSYLVPGLGQIVQGRYGKGLLFMGCLLGLFFYGMYLGHWRNVYIEVVDAPSAIKGSSPRGNFIELVVVRVRFFGQCGIGVAAWPAIIQYATYTPPPRPVRVDPDGTPLDVNGQAIVDAHPIFGKFERPPTEAEQNDLQRSGDKNLDLGWTYTVIAGVLNWLVIYDALAGAAFSVGAAAAARPRPPVLSSEKIAT